jgi:hypothetical protein
MEGVEETLRTLHYLFLLCFVVTVIAIVVDVCKQPLTQTHSMESGRGPRLKIFSIVINKKRPFALFVGPVEECIATIENTVKVQAITQ